MGCCVSTPPDNIQNHIENHNVKTNNNSKSAAITNDKNIEIVYNDNTTDSKPKEQQNTTTITNKNDIQIVYPLIIHLYLYSTQIIHHQQIQRMD